MTFSEWKPDESKETRWQREYRKRLNYVSEARFQCPRCKKEVDFWHFAQMYCNGTGCRLFDQWRQRDGAVFHGYRCVCGFEGIEYEMCKHLEGADLETHVAQAVMMGVA